jgi:signal transduction histidine kinase
VTTSTGPPDRPAQRQGIGTVLRAPWTARPWRATAHVLVGPVVSAVPAALIVALGALTVVLAVVPPLAAGTLTLLLATTRAATTMQRSRYAAFLAVDIPPVARAYPGDGWLRRLSTEARSRSTWRQVGYHLLAPYLAVAGWVVVVTSWSVGIALGTAPLHGWPRVGLFGLSLHDPVTLIALTAVGLVAFVAAPWLARAVATADAAVARALLGPSHGERLARRVESLTASRAGVVDAADTERRRIERDLHDGAQQRLTSLALKLGIARETLTDLSEPARVTIAGAHEDAIQALAELRDLVRGLHPAVLDDRGLDAALSGIAARAPVPVTLQVHLPRRPSAITETVAYFVVSESLANVAKHAHASRAEVTVESVLDGRGNGRLHVSVTDDGRGGADPRGGTGLQGLSQRVAAVDGTLRIDSPPGGPTTITVDLPCAS